MAAENSAVGPVDEPEILAALLERPGQVVSRSELAARLWEDDTEVDIEHGLNAAIKRLRAKLGDSATNPRFIETLPGRGYRLRVDPPPVTPAPSVNPSKGAAPIALALVVWSDAGGVQLVPLSGNP